MPKIPSKPAPTAGEALAALFPPPKIPSKPARILAVWHALVRRSRTRSE
jgi:hypothetical protein